MNLISQIIDDLTEDSKSLNSSLLKTKVLADKMDNDAVFSWVNNEINGYPDINVLPEYRILPASAIGTFANRFQILRNVSIPTNGLDHEVKEALTKMRISNSVSNLEHHINNDRGELGVSIPLDLCAYLSQHISINGQLQFGKITVGRNMIVELLNNVRSRLLEFLLKIRKEFNDDENYSESKQMIDNIFNGTIIGSNFIFSGNHNQQTVNFTVNKDDTNSLIEYLRKNKLDENDIKEIENIIKDETPDCNSKVYGPKLKQWMTKMIGKAIDGTWNVTVTVASKILTEAISKYYGF